MLVERCVPICAFSCMLLGAAGDYDDPDNLCMPVFAHAGAGVLSCIHHLTVTESDIFDLL